MSTIRSIPPVRRPSHDRSARAPSGRRDPPPEQRVLPEADPGVDPAAHRRGGQGGGRRPVPGGDVEDGQRRPCPEPATAGGRDRADIRDEGVARRRGRPRHRRRARRRRARRRGGAAPPHRRGAGGRAPPRHPTGRRPTSRRRRPSPRGSRPARPHPRPPRRRRSRAPGSAADDPGQSRRSRTMPYSGSASVNPRAARRRSRSTGVVDGPSHHVVGTEPRSRNAASSASIRASIAASSPASSARSTWLSPSSGRPPAIHVASGSSMTVAPGRRAIAESAATRAASDSVKRGAPRRRRRPCATRRDGRDTPRRSRRPARGRPGPSPSRP